MSAPASTLGGRPAPALSARCLALYELLRQVASKGGYTPKIGELLAALRDLGHRSSNDAGVVYFDIIRLVEAGLVRTHGAARTRVYEVIGVGSTIRRPGKALSAETLAMMSARGALRSAENAGWPRPTKDSAAAYDAAVAAKAFADGRPAAQSWTHSAIRPAASGRSLTGCAAAMSVEAV
ncbi:MAG: hypothetical protein ACRC67_33265 [Inquilinus sp.]|uniref:hypothetical protein n=1 Tax=Inquilinus sp. TaxID=1932117 RepID=UPI003F3B671F